MNFEKPIWQFFKINRNEFNSFDRKAEKILRDVYEQGKKDGKKEQAKLIVIMGKRLAK